MKYLTTHTSLSPIRRGFAPGFVNYKKGALYSQPQVIKFTKTGRHDIALILLKVYCSDDMSTVNMSEELW
jgi:hypothetical protein